MTWRTPPPFFNDALSRGEQLQNLTRVFATIRNGPPSGEMKALVEGMRDDRDRHAAEVRHAARPLVDVGAEERLVVALMDATTNLATHDTLFVLLGAAMLTDAPQRARAGTAT